MDHLGKLFNLIEATRAQPQYGYVLSNLQKHELSDLAQHHYLVTFFAWQIARQLESSGVQIDLVKTLEFALIHDIGELFGGDISWPYARVNPKARKYAKAFEEENQKFLSNYFGEGKNYFRKIAKEILDAKLLESVVAKVADYVECAQYRQYLGKLTKGDVQMTIKALQAKVSKLKDKEAQKLLNDFILKWSKGLTPMRSIEPFESEKKTFKS